MRHGTDYEHARQARIMSLYKAGHTRAEIARTLGISRQCVSFIIGGEYIKKGIY